MSQAPDDHNAALPQSELTAEQLLTKLAKMIIDTNDANELTKDLIESTFDVQLEQYEEDVADYAARLTSDWNFVISLSSFASSSPAVTLRFVPREDRPDLTMTDICSIDADAFGGRLEQAGFTGTAIRDVHGLRHYGTTYRRGSLWITVLTEGEANEPDEKLTHACITMVQVQNE